MLKGDQARSFFTPLPNADEAELPVVDERRTLDRLDTPGADRRGLATLGPEVRAACL